MKNKDNFVRGDVFSIFLPSADLTPEHCPPPPDYLLNGIHKLICLTSSDDPKVPSNQVLMVPISTAKSAVTNNRLTMTHLELPKETFNFLDHTSYALLFQPRPVNRVWLNNHICNVTDYDENIMKQISILTLFANGSYDDVMEMAYEKLKDQILKEHNLSS